VPYSRHLQEPHTHEDTSISVNMHSPSTCSKKAVISDPGRISCFDQNYYATALQIRVTTVLTGYQETDQKYDVYNFIRATSTHRRESEIRRMQGTKFLGKISNTSYAT